MNNLIHLSGIGKFSNKKKIRFFINIAIGCLIAIALHYTERTDRGENAINYGLDLFIRHEAGKAFNEKYQNEQILFIDIDHKTYRKWQRPLLTPRDEVAKIIEHAYNGRAKVVVLDILLEDKDCCYPDRDEKLKNILEQLVEDKSSMKIIFATRVDNDGKIRRNIYDNLIDENPDFYRGIPAISATSTDLKNRYWVSFKTAKVNNKDYTVLWGIPLLTAALAEGKTNKLQEIENEIRKRLRSNYLVDTRTFKIMINQKDIFLSSKREDLYSQRIHFLIIPSGTVFTDDNLFENQLVVKDLKLPQGEKNRSKFYEPFKDKIVVVGNSSPDAGDIHLTPLGNMPGMYIIGNSINTIINDLHLSTIPWWLNIIAEVIVVIGAAYIFSIFPSLLAKISVTVIILIVFVPLSWLLFRVCGIYFNFVLPLTCIGLYEMTRSIEEAFIEIRS